MTNEELVTEIISTLKLPDNLGTTLAIEKKLNELIDETGGKSIAKYM